MDDTATIFTIGGSGPNPPAGNTSFLESGRGVIRTDVVLDGNGRVVELIDDRGAPTIACATGTLTPGTAVTIWRNGAGTPARSGLGGRSTVRTRTGGGGRTLGQASPSGTGTDRRVMEMANDPGSCRTVPPSPTPR
jgi:hypothetical protein